LKAHSHWRDTTSTSSGFSADSEAQIARKPVTPGVSTKLTANALLTSSQVRPIAMLLRGWKGASPSPSRGRAANRNGA